MEIRDDDVLLISFPKTGTHWTLAIMQMLRAKSTDCTFQPINLLEMGGFMRAGNMTSPRWLNTHLPYRYVPKQAFEKKIKMVIVNRNPKDQMVSMFHHLSSMVGQTAWEGTFEHFFYHRMEFGGYYGNMFDYYLEWQTALEALPGQVLEVVYE